MSTPDPHIDAATERRIEQSLERRHGFLPRRELLTETLFAVILLASATALAVLATPARPFSAALALAFVAAYAAVARVEFVFGDSRTMPVQLVLVPMFLLLPTPLVPLLTVAGVVLAQAWEIVRGTRPLRRLLLPIPDAGNTLAPALVLVICHAQLPAWASWPAYLAAFAAQLLSDSAFGIARFRLALGTPVRELAGEAAKVWQVDGLLSPMGLLAAIAAKDDPGFALLVLPLVLLLGVFAREREGRIAQTIELSKSYRGTALLLRDLLEDDDEYTGHHTEDVVDLSVRVAGHLGLSEALKRETELGALLHDIGKIHIPDAIINKPGPLDADEWALMKTHTIEGQKMLDRVGGMLSSVGLVVRASHERWDGGGYPDGLAGEAIPPAARIVAVCDAFNAMTTTRSYRAAMPVSAAVTELRRCAGTQFDPRVVDALLDVIGDPGWELTVREPAIVKGSDPSTIRQTA